MYPLKLQTSTDRTMTEDNIIISTTMWWSYVPIKTPNLNRQDNDRRQHNYKYNNVVELCRFM
jgi:hypothetical protein